MHSEVIVGGVERDKCYSSRGITVELGSAVAAVKVIFDVGVQRSVEADPVLVEGAGSKGKPVFVDTAVLNAASTGWVLSKSTLSR